MNAYRKTHVRPLHEMLPLPLPETIHLDPVNLCNFRCSFCPTADKGLLKSVGRPNGVMDYDLYVRIVDDLHAMVQRAGRKLSTLHLYKDGEPLLNPRLPEMAAYAKKAQVAHVVSTTSNGSLLTRELASRLIDSGLDQIRISVVHVEEKTFQELTQTKVPYQRILENVAFLYHEKRRRGSPLRVIVKTNDSGLTAEHKERFERDYSSIADLLAIDTMMGWSLSDVKDFTLGVQVTTGMDGSSPLRERQVCPEPFSRLAINWDGQVSICCVDWSYGTIVGDLRTQTLEEVWGGEPLRAIRLAHLTGNRASIRACAECQYSKGAPPSRDLDGHVDRLLEIYGGKAAAK
ncbi:MAG: radical SAM protein [Candidatus Eisenbacteria bacterium]|nr:radical SAM protein [Candidatus Eisenbacteria bacterium]